MKTQAIKKISLIKAILLIVIVIVIGLLPNLMFKNIEFEGTDEKAEQAITEVMGDYKPWFTPVFQPKSEQTERVLFALQAAIGAGVLVYGFIYMQKRKKKEEAKKNDIH